MNLIPKQPYYYFCGASWLCMLHICTVGDYQVKNQHDFILK